MMKTCTKCGEQKPITEFCKDALRLEGFRSQCKNCTKAADAKWYAANREKVKAASATYRVANADRCKAYNAAYSAANSEKRRADSAQWRIDNPEKHRATIAQWQAANPEARRIHKHNRRARKLESGGKLSPGLSAKLFSLQRGKCACCGQPLGTNYHLDHRMPLALGGQNVDSNMQLLRANCNLQKSAKHPIYFMQQKGFLL